MIYHISAFDLRSDGHGGNCRSAQVAEFLREIAPVDDSPFPPVQPIWRCSPASLKAVGRVGLKAHWLLASELPATIRYANRLKALTSASVFALEKYYWDPALFLAAAGTRPLVVFPQNIESLVLGQARSLNSDPRLDLAMELELLSLANFCVAISEEDASILARTCRTVFVLPYYPSSRRLESLLSVRNARKAKVKKHILVLGTANNPPTREGIEKLLCGLGEYLGAAGAKASMPIVLVGHGTEVFANRLPEIVRLEGSVSSQRLEQLQIEASALVVYHPETTGALTRIVESLICGVPVIANKSALRGQVSLLDVKTTDDMTEIWDSAFNISEAAIPRVPSRPVSFEEAIRQAFSTLLAK